MSEIITEKSKEYHFYKDLGICVRCHKEQAEPHMVMCWECQDKEKLYDRKKRERQIDKARQKDKEKYARLKAEGICVYCKHEKAVLGKSKCKKCLAIIRNKRRANNNDIDRSERVSYGLCYICGKNSLMKDKKVCERCYEKRLKSISKIMYMPANDFWKKENDILFSAKK